MRKAEKRLNLIYFGRIPVSKAHYLGYIVSVKIFPNQVK